MKNINKTNALTIKFDSGVKLNELDNSLTVDSIIKIFNAQPFSDDFMQFIDNNNLNNELDNLAGDLLLNINKELVFKYVKDCIIN